MKKKTMDNKITRLVMAAMIAMCAIAFASCGGGDGLEDGTYIVDVDTGSNMFHVNEANEGKGLLTVKDGEMNVHISLASKKIVNVYAGPKSEAEAEGAELIEPTKDMVTYDDGITEEVYGFDIPVPAIDEEFPVSIIGTHDNWYEHNMMVTNPVEGSEIPGMTAEAAEGSDTGETKELKASDKSLEDLKTGEYKAIVTKEGGTGRADIESPAKLVVEDGKATLTLVWSSPNYDYMIVDGEKYEPVNKEGNSTFEIPVKELGKPFDVVADTTAMSKPHDVVYTLFITMVVYRTIKFTDIPKICLKAVPSSCMIAIIICGWDRRIFLSPCTW